MMSSGCAGPTSPLGQGRLALGRKRAQRLALRIGRNASVEPSEILGTRRQAAIVTARHVLFVELFRAGYSIAEVATILEMDHTSIIHGMRRSMGDDIYDQELRERYPDCSWLRSVVKSKKEVSK